MWKLPWSKVYSNSTKELSKDKDKDKTPQRICKSGHNYDEKNNKSN